MKASLPGDSKCSMMLQAFWLTAKWLLSHCKVTATKGSNPETTESFATSYLACFHLLCCVTTESHPIRLGKNSLERFGNCYWILFPALSTAVKGPSEGARCEGRQPSHCSTRTTQTHSSHSIAQHVGVRLQVSVMVGGCAIHVKYREVVYISVLVDLRHVQSAILLLSLLFSMLLWHQSWPCPTGEEDLFSNDLASDSFSPSCIFWS